jgi:glutamyl/glutaminyl-tRNA synthetase
MYASFASTSIINTRFEPTINGHMHIGHYATILCNEQLAHGTDGGKFSLRFDDVQGQNRLKFGDRQIRDWCTDWLLDLAWLQVGYDEVYFEHQFTKVLDRLLVELLGAVPDNTIIPEWRASRISDIPGHLYQYTPYLTAQRVLLDWIADVNWVVRGEELITETALYQYFVDRFGLPRPQFLYLPKLVFGSTDAAQMISKTAGGWQISSLREQGYTPLILRQMVEEAYLYNSVQGWQPANIRPHPYLTEAVG